MGTGLNASFITGLSDVETTDKEGVGKVRLEGGKWYKWVKLYNDTATVAGVAGDIACYAKETGQETYTVVLDKTDADSKPIGAGALVAAVTGTVDTAYYCWVQTKGPATLAVALGGSAGDGDTLMPGATDKALEKLTNDDSTETNDGHPCAVANDASAKKVTLDCPF